MTSTTFFFVFVPIVAILLLAINLLFAPHNPYEEKDSAFECGFHSFLGQNRTQFTISFFIFALLFLLFDLEILLVYPYVVSAYTNDIFGLIVMILFFVLLTIGFVFEIGKNALKIDSRQSLNSADKSKSSIYVSKTVKTDNVHLPPSSLSKKMFLASPALTSLSSSYEVSQSDDITTVALPRSKGDEVKPGQGNTSQEREPKLINTPVKLDKEGVLKYFNYLDIKTISKEISYRIDLYKKHPYAAAYLSAKKEECFENLRYIVAILVEHFPQYYECTSCGKYVIVKIIDKKVSLYEGDVILALLYVIPYDFNIMSKEEKTNEYILVCSITLYSVG